ncbi:MAG: hypothetical protein AAF591_14290 [Verrucomicrobiota bacterium]
MSIRDGWGGILAGIVVGWRRWFGRLRRRVMGRGRLGGTAGGVVRRERQLELGLREDGRGR